MHQVIPIIPRTPFTAVANTLEIPLARNVGIGGAVSGVLIVKVHASPSAGTWTVHAQNAATSSEDPGINFIDGSRDVASVAVTGSTYNLWHDALEAPIGEQVNVFLSTPGSTAATIIISVDLVIRDS